MTENITSPDSTLRGDSLGLNVAFGCLYVKIRENDAIYMYLSQT